MGRLAAAARQGWDFGRIASATMCSSTSMAQTESILSQARPWLLAWWSSREWAAPDSPWLGLG